TRLQGVSLPRLEHAPMALEAVGVACAVAILSGLLVALVPALVAVRASLSDVLKAGPERGAGRTGALRAGLVVVQTAVALVLVAAAASLASSLVAVLRMPLGFDARNALTMRIALTPDRYPTRLAGAQFFERLSESLRGLPGVQSVGVASAL